VVALAVVVHQPMPGGASFDPLPFYSLATLKSAFAPDAAACPQCAKGVPVTKIWP
jgi:hypothetical protein